MKLPEKENAIKNLEEVIDDLILNDKGEAIEVLKEENIDFNDLVKRNLEFIKKLQVRTNINLTKEKNKQKLLDLAIQKLGELKRKTDSPKKILKSLLEDSKNKELSLQFRKLENMSDEEALEILDETQLLELLNSLDKE